MLVPNPRDNPNKIATAVCYPQFISKDITEILTKLCDRRAFVPGMVVRQARVYRHVYLVFVNGEPHALVDDWDMGVSPSVRPVATVFCTISQLVSSRTDRMVSGEVIHKARLGLHAHIRQMDEYLKEWLDQKRIALDSYSLTERPMRDWSGVT